MTTAPDTTIACTLPPGALPRRLAWIRRVTANDLLAHRLEGNALHLTYRARAGDELAQVVAEERRCCSFLRFSLRDVAEGVELHIEAPAEAGADARWLFEHFLPSPAPRPCGCAPGSCG